MDNELPSPGAYTMQRLPLALIAVTIMSACTPSLATTPTPTQLTGQWGGDRIGVSDSLAAHGVLVSIGCAIALFPAPIPVNSLGAFEAFGAIILDVYPPNIGRRTRISGHVVGDSLALDWTWTLADDPNQFGDPPIHFQLVHGRAPNWTGLLCTV
jgi:hypothetical protein